MQNLQLNFDYRINDIEGIFNNEHKPYHSEDTYINEIEKKENQIAKMEKNQELLIKRNIELENDISRLQDVVLFKMNKMKDTQYNTINHFNKESLNRSSINQDCHKGNISTKCQRDDQLALDKHNLSNTDSNYLSSRTGVSGKKREIRIKAFNRIETSNSKPRIRDMSLSKINNKNNSNVSLKAASTRAQSIKRQKPNSKSSPTRSAKPNKNSTSEIEDTDAELMNKIAYLQKQINNIKAEMYLNEIESKGECFLIQEIDEWKQRNAILSKSAIESIHFLQKAKENSRREFNNEINNTLNYCNYISNDLANQCEALLKKQQKTIECHHNYNNSIKQRLSKAGTIIIGKKYKQ